MTSNTEEPTNIQKAKPVKERVIDLLKEALTGHSARSKNTIITEALILVGELK